MSFVSVITGSEYTEKIIMSTNEKNNENTKKELENEQSEERMFGESLLKKAIAPIQSKKRMQKYSVGMDVAAQGADSESTLVIAILSRDREGKTYVTIQET